MRFSRKLGLFCGLFVLGGAPALGAEAVPMRLAFVRGEVLVDGVKVKEGQPLQNGQMIETRQGKCTILLGGNHVIHLDSESRFKIEKYQVDSTGETAEFDLKYGRTRALVQSQKPSDPMKKRVFKIRSRTAVMGVRGTHVYIDSPKDPKVPQNFMTIEGVAELSDSRSANPSRVIPLRKAEAVLVRSDETVAASDLKVVRVSPEKMRELSNGIQPPPAEVGSREDLRRMRDRPPRAPGEFRPGFSPGGGLEPVFGQKPLPLDPVADNRVPVHVTVSVKKY